MKQTAKTCRQAGFTLVEIMVVVAIIGLLIPAYYGVYAYAMGLGAEGGINKPHWHIQHHVIRRSYGL